MGLLLSFALYIQAFVKLACVIPAFPFQAVGAYYRARVNHGGMYNASHYHHPLLTVPADHSQQDCPQCRKRTLIYTVIAISADAIATSIYPSTFYHFICFLALTSTGFVAVHKMPVYRSVIVLWLALYAEFATIYGLLEKLFGESLLENLDYAEVVYFVGLVYFTVLKTTVLKQNQNLENEPTAETMVLEQNQNLENEPTAGMFIVLKDGAPAVIHVVLILSIHFINIQYFSATHTETHLTRQTSYEILKTAAILLALKCWKHFTLPSHKSSVPLLGNLFRSIYRRCYK